MSTLVTLLLPAVLGAGAPVETLSAQVAPKFREPAFFARSEGQSRAVVLIHGMHVYPVSNKKPGRAAWSGWQQPDSVLVKALAPDADVYAFAYSQNAAVERIAGEAGLGDLVKALKKLGYADVVLVGHSAGGLIARLFVEDNPDAGVTKVIQACAPNTGTSWGNLKLGVRDSQEPFLESLCKKGRDQCLKGRAEKRIPDKVEFVCLVGVWRLKDKAEDEEDARLLGLVALPRLHGDGIVSCASQWSEDLQKQGIPAVLIGATHNAVVRGKPGAEQIAKLVKEKQPRWDEQQMAEAKKKILK